MAVERAGAPTASPEKEARIYEQPLNERLRTFLRVDFLYNQALYHNEMASQWGSRAAMSCLLDVLAIATRGDLRSDVLKELERQLSTLNEFQARPGVDSSRLRTVMSNLMRLRAELMQAGSAFLQPLRESEFLSAIKHRSAIPGGTNEYEVTGRGNRTAHMGCAEIACWCPPRADTLGGPQRNLPDDSIAAKVDADEGPPGRRRARQSKWRQQRFATHCVRGARLAREL